MILLRIDNDLVHVEALTVLNQYELSIDNIQEGGKMFMVVKGRDLDNARRFFIKRMELALYVVCPVCAKLNLTMCDHQVFIGGKNVFDNSNWCCGNTGCEDW